MSGPSATVVKKSLQRRMGRSFVVGIQVLCGVHFFNEHIAEIRPCSGASMYPTLALSGDFILQSRLTTLFPSLSSRFPLERGTLVTAISPSDPSHQVLKRVIGIAGDTICVDPSGERARERRLKREAGSEGDGINIITGLEFLEGASTMRTEQRIGQEEIEMEDEEPKWIKIPKGRVWLSGDNASNSTDSRDYGPVPVALLRGRVVARVWPNPRWLGSNMRSVKSP